jgi:outer membrane protein assembly factor BamD
VTVARRLLYGGALVLAAGCGGPKVRIAPTAETLLAEARGEFRSGRFQKALLAFQRLNVQLAPGHPDAAEVGYFVAEGYFQTGDRVTAASEFRKVADQHPGSSYAPQALLRAGDAHLRLWRRPQLDPTPGQTALALYQELAGRYPESDAAARAQLHVRRLRAWFAEKAYDNGLFYLRRRAYDSAMLYFKDVVATYPEAPRAADALIRLVDTYRAINYRQELEETCTHLRRFYPQAEGLAERCPAAPGTG